MCDAKEEREYKSLRERGGIVTEEVMVSRSLQYLYHNGFCGQTHVTETRERRTLKKSKMSISHSHSSSLVFSSHNPTSVVSALALPPDSTTASQGSLAGHMPHMNAGHYGQVMGTQGTGLHHTVDNRNGESAMGLGYLPYSNCLTSGTSERPAQHSHIVQQEFSQFLLPPPPSTLRQPGHKRGLSKDSVEYRMRRERNNIAVRKSRDKARRRIQLTQQRALQLQEENHRLQLHIERLSHEVETLRHYLSQRHLQTKVDDTGVGENC
ncbi:CCAAT/enhancer binding protein (C/EBP) 1 [Brachyhypopomus gauderio]|uniref:CCAAT/enhancer binding protein (C/EBP) 1 n=1 Tax=Brachyhypopomus gauderio TaxID=698409 RepID=UPI0040429B27